MLSDARASIITRCSCEATAVGVLQNIRYSEGAVVPVLTTVTVIAPPGTVAARPAARFLQRSKLLVEKPHLLLT